MNSIEARLIDPETKTISMILISLDEDNEPDLDEVYEILKCSQVEAIKLSNNRTLLFDEEALLLDKDNQFFGFSDPATPVKLISGRALLIQNDSDWYPINYKKESTFKVTWPSKEAAIQLINQSNEVTREVVEKINQSNEVTREVVEKINQSNEVTREVVEKINQSNEVTREVVEKINPFFRFQNYTKTNV